MESHIQVGKEPLMKSYFVYKAFKTELLNGKWKLGEKLSINELCKTYDVSRRPVMDAMKMLENDGFVEIVPQSGCSVIEYSEDDFIELILLSASIESLCAKLAAENHTETELLSLINYHNDMKNTVLIGDEYQDYINYNREFHIKIFEMSHSDKIFSYALKLMDLNVFYLSNLFAQNKKVDVKNVITEHDQIIAALKSKDGDKTKMLMDNHVRKYMEY